MDYSKMINETLEYIEENLDENISLKKVSEMFLTSEYHFNRIFKFMIGVSYKKYLLSRKLSKSLIDLKETSDSILNISLNYGFEYVEVYSRAFKKQFLISPNDYRKSKVTLMTIEKAQVIERDFVNFNGGFTLRADFVFLGELNYYGKYNLVDTSAKSFLKDLEKGYEIFQNEVSNYEFFNTKKNYHIVTCLGDEVNFEVFYGYELIEEVILSEVKEANFYKKSINPSWYAKFNYIGDMIHIYPTFTEDIFKWIKDRKVPLKLVEAGMIVVFKEDYNSSKEMEIFIQVQRI